ncbi:putative low-complexity protein [Cylindrospermum stagnale PCC 7417]|uniref:Putative low-complexity protein n=1 Tax=Cylindrospermum stagnale PCC 7417 TaxID=56107 RepID=K9WWG4_9NOST|nr:pentapeptide repeat-containing protein [Cylindrospermum stagnale]AFZ24116.1 putative low-complexity protein [Cylindrospermum stagnale PCC 7417]
MANQEHFRILIRGVEFWNEWREENPEIEPDLSEADLREADLRGADLSGAALSGVYLRGADLSRTNLRGAYLIEADLTRADLRGVNLSEAYLRAAYLSGVDLRGADLRGADLRGADLIEADLSRANLSGADFTRIQALETNFTRATLTGACIEDWHTNSNTELDNVICEYIYLRENQQERRPSSGKFAPGEFTKLFQKSLETIDLIFRNGIDWDAFAYSFKKIEIENQGAQLDVNIIEKKGDGVIVVRINASPDADKTKIHGDFMQGYEFAHKALEAQYQARIEDKDKFINQLFSTINQQNKQLAENSGKLSIYYQPNSQFAGGIVDAQTVNVKQIGGEIQN